MNKSQLIDAVSRASGLEKRQSERAVDALVSTVIGEVKGGRKVALVGFGTFNPTSRAARQGRNPQTGAPVRIAASRGVRFAAGSTFKAAVNNRGPVPTVEPLPPPAPSRAPVRKAKKAARKSAAKRSTARRGTAKRTAKKATARRAPARKSTKRTAKKATARRAPARKSTKRTAKRSTRRR